MSDKPNPGSDEAVEQGCQCPVMDNWRGDPEMGRIRGFIVTQGCPVHDGGKPVSDFMGGNENPAQPIPEPEGAKSDFPSRTNPDSR